ncbi:MAG: YceI family protein [Myxococcales bacterium]|nr:YceI family protein [Myxococcales bacterium]
MAASRWDFDLSHSSINFWARHMMVSKVHGRFGRWSGALELDEQDPSLSRVEVQIDAASIETKEQKRDEHLSSADFLEVAKHPHLTFKSTAVTREGEQRFKVVGELTIRGISRPVTLDVEYAGRAKDPWGGERAGFSARTSINRKDFGLTWNMALEAGGFVVGDKVEIDIEVEAVKAKPVEAEAPSARAEARG